MNQTNILVRIRGEIARLERVVLQVKELKVVVAQNVLERDRRRRVRLATRVSWNPLAAADFTP